MPPEGGRETVGIVAGWGRYPVVVAQALRARGFAVACVGLAGHYDAALPEHCDYFRVLGIGRLGGGIRQFRRWNVHRATLVGKFHKVRLFEPGFLLGLLPDWRTIRAFYRHFLPTGADRKDDTLLSVVCQEFARDGIAMVPATDFAPELLVKSGVLTRRAPQLSQKLDIEFGWALAKEMGRLDVGQSVAVKGRAVLAVEAVEGTDACIRRAGELCKSGGFTVIKVAKPQQDMRFDVPTVGVGTIESMIAARASVLAIESGKTILIDECDVVELANRHGLVIVALENPTAGDYTLARTSDPETTCRSRER